MTALRTHGLAVALSASFLSVVLSFVFLFKAGCVGDSKGGAVGDPVLALQLENIAGSLFLLGVLCGGAAFVLRQNRTLPKAYP